MTRVNWTEERLKSSNEGLTRKASIDKMVDLINLYHSIESRYGTADQKTEAKTLIRQEVKKLKKQVGSHFASRSLYYLTDQGAWNDEKNSFL